MEIRPPGVLVRGWSQELNGSVRCSGDALIAPTAAQTDGRNLPPERPRTVRPEGSRTQEDKI
eukprot:scaffold56354_cov61-Phaeocystis_antarctica.AAC.1